MSMAKFSRKEKLLLKEISKKDCILDIFTLAAKFYDIRNFSLLLTKQDSNKVIVLAKENLDEGLRREEYIRIVSLLSFLDRLEKEGLVYIINDERDALFCSQGKTLPVVKTDIGYEISNCRIELIGEKIEFRDQLGRKVLTGDNLPNSLSCVIKHLLGNTIFPTEELLYLIRNNFEQTEDKALKYAKYSLWVAIFAIVLSIFAVPISNKWGVTTLDSKQYNAIIMSIKGIAKTGIGDTVCFKNVSSQNNQKKQVK